MKKLIITHMLLNLYLLVLVQPALPVLEYLINYDYIVNELCENKDKPILTCNGKCYLGDQVEKQLDLDHDHQSPMPPKIDFEKFISLQDEPQDERSSIETQKNKIPLFTTSLEDQLFEKSLLRPPQA